MQCPKLSILDAENNVEMITMTHFTLCVECPDSGKVKMPDGSVESIVCLNPNSPRYRQGYFIDNLSHRELIQGRDLYEWEHPISNFKELGCKIP
jgi:hypothetical protein